MNKKDEEFESKIDLFTLISVVSLILLSFTSFILVNQLRVNQDLRERNQNMTQYIQGENKQLVYVNVSIIKLKNGS